MIPASTVRAWIAKDNIAYGAPHGLRLHDGDIMASFWAGQAGIMGCRWARLRVV